MLLSLGCAIPEQEQLLDATMDAAAELGDAAPPDAASAPDGALVPDLPSDLGTDNGVDILPEATPPDTAWADLPAEALGPDAAPADPRPVCTPTRTMYNMALERGRIPNGCPGGVFLCGERGGGETWRATGTSRWQPRVYNCTQQAQREHGEWFDPALFRDTSSGLVLAPQAGAYVAFVARSTDGRGAVSVVDTNAPGNEVRVRGADDAVAEHFPDRGGGVPSASAAPRGWRWCARSTAARPGRKGGRGSWRGGERDPSGHLPRRGTTRQETPLGPSLRSTRWRPSGASRA